MPQLARCVFDSLALSYRNVKEELETLCGAKLTQIRVVGGGSRNVSSINSVPTPAVCRSCRSGGSIGSGQFCAQMIALGVIENLEAARLIIRHSFRCGNFAPRRYFPKDPEVASGVA